MHKPWDILQVRNILQVRTPYSYGRGYWKKTQAMKALRSLLARAAGADPAVMVRIDPSVRYQTLRGWGTSLAWWGLVVGGWSDPARNAIADLLFSLTDGLGLTVVRYNIGGGDDPAHDHMRPGGAVPGFQPAPGVWDWSADAGQRWMLQAARARGATVCEAFANSPPYWMTRSGCAAGAADAGDNLHEAHIEDFAAYLAAVVAHVRDEWDLVFQTVEPFNEPSSPHWKSLNRQEGCHISHPQQRAVIERLAAHLAAHGLAETAISAADEYSIDETVATLNAYDATTLSRVAQVNTHSYAGTRRADVRALAAAHGKRLWMSEFGTGEGPHDHVAIAPALRLAEQIRRDLNDLQPEAWVYWQAVENETTHNWGFIHADFTGGSEAYWPTKQYYAMGNFSRFIRPGYKIIGVDDLHTLAACEPSSGALVLVYVNSAPQDAPVRFGLSGFDLPPSTSATPHRTSADENLARLPDLRVSNQTLATCAAAHSITTYVID